MWATVLRYAIGRRMRLTAINASETMIETGRKTMKKQILLIFISDSRLLVHSKKGRAMILTKEKENGNMVKEPYFLL